MYTDLPKWQNFHIFVINNNDGLRMTSQCFCQHMCPKCLKGSTVRGERKALFSASGHPPHVFFTHTMCFSSPLPADDFHRACTSTK